MPVLFKILPRIAWNGFRESGRFGGSEVDLQDGFIHFSYAHQLAETARRHFAGQSDLVLLEVAGDRLGQALREEPSRGGDLFPHLYGDLDLAAVLAVKPIGQDCEGMPVLPALAES